MDKENNNNNEEVSIPIDEFDSRGLNEALQVVRSLENRLGALRCEYLRAETRLMTELSHAYNGSDALLKAVARRYAEGKEGQWQYDPAKKALIKLR